VESEKKRMQESVKEKWKSDREATLKQHESFLQMAADLEGNNSNGGTSRSLVCATPSCQRSYKKEHLLIYRSCCADDCRTHEFNCGCDVKQCDICCRFLCSYHMPLHTEQCKEKEKERHEKWKHKRPAFDEEKEGHLRLVTTKA